jgi:RimJ/RimL family protein N-acetyltransferase
LLSSGSIPAAQPLDLQPHLRCPRVEIRPLRESDFAALYAVAADPLIWEQHPARDRWREPVFREFFDAGIASGGALLLRDAATQAVVGTSRYAGYEPQRSEVEIGWTFLARSFWGGGFNAAVKQLMLDHAFAAVESVVFGVGVDNLRSQQAVLKLGAVFEGLEAGDGPPHYRYRLARTAHLARKAGV